MRHNLKTAIAGGVVGAALVGVTALGVQLATASGSGPDTGNRGIPYRGYLELNGAPVDGYVNMRICVDTGGDCFVSAGGDRWVASYPNVPVYAGGFEVEIGPDGTTESSTPLPAWVFDSSEVYVQVEINGEALAGAQRIQPVPASYWSAEATDLDVSGSLRVDGSATIDGTLRVPGSNALAVGGVNDDVNIKRNSINFYNNNADEITSVADLSIRSGQELSLRSVGRMIVNGVGGMSLQHNGEDEVRVGAGTVAIVNALEVRGGDGTSDVNIGSNGIVANQIVSNGDLTVRGSLDSNDATVDFEADIYANDGLLRIDGDLELNSGHKIRGATTVTGAETNGIINIGNAETFSLTCPAGTWPISPRVLYADSITTYADAAPGESGGSYPGTLIRLASARRLGRTTELTVTFVNPGGGSYSGGVHYRAAVDCLPIELPSD